MCCSRARVISPGEVGSLGYNAYTVLVWFDSNFRDVAETLGMYTDRKSKILQIQT